MPGPGKAGSGPKGSRPPPNYHPPPIVPKAGLALGCSYPPLLCLKALGPGPAPYPAQHHPPSQGDMGCPKHPVTLLCSGPKSPQASILHRCLFTGIPDCNWGPGSLPTYFALRVSSLCCREEVRLPMGSRECGCLGPGGTAGMEKLGLLARGGATAPSRPPQAAFALPSSLALPATYLGAGSCI